MIKEQFIVDLSLVDELLDELRVDKYLAEVCEDLSRTEIKDYFDESLITVNNKIVKPSFKVKNNDLIDMIEKEKKSLI